MPLLPNNRHEHGYAPAPSVTEPWPIKHDPARLALTLPKVDLETFNYGRALGAPDNAEYVAARRYTQALDTIASRFSGAAWSLTMALRDVRLAETEYDQGTAMERLRETLHKADRDLERVECLPLRFFRYGRIGNVLKHFNPFRK